MAISSIRCLGFESGGGDGRFQSRAGNRRHNRVRRRLPRQCLPSRQLPAPGRQEPGLLPQIRRRFGTHRRRHFHPHVAGGCREPAGLSPLDLQRRVQSHPADEGSLARRLYPRRRARLLRYSLCYVLLRRGPGQVGPSSFCFFLYIYI